MLLCNLIKEAAKESPYAADLDNDYIETLISEYTNSPGKCLLYNDYGFIAGSLSKGHILLPNVLVALEIAWYVLPEHRHKMVGGKLYKQFKAWAKENGAKIIFTGKKLKGSTLVQLGYMTWV